MTLPEATPVYEAQRLRDDLNRTGIDSRWWVVNQCLSLGDATDPMSNPSLYPLAFDLHSKNSTGAIVDLRTLTARQPSQTFSLP